MSVFKDLDINIQDLQDAVRLTRNAHHNTPYRDVDPEEAELDVRQQLATKLLRMGWVPPVYASEMKLRLLSGERDKALSLLCDVLDVDESILPEVVAA